MQPFALAVTELKAVELAVSAQKAWTPGEGTLPEDEVLEEEAR